MGLGNRSFHIFIFFSFKVLTLSGLSINFAAPFPLLKSSLPVTRITPPACVVTAGFETLGRVASRLWNSLLAPHSQSISNQHRLSARPYTISHFMVLDVSNTFQDIVFLFCFLQSSNQLFSGTPFSCSLKSDVMFEHKYLKSY